MTISRGRRGVRIFTPDKEQLRENVSRSGHRPLALELAEDFVPRRVSNFGITCMAICFDSASARRTSFAI